MTNDNEYYVSDKWTQHANGCWSINRKGVCHLVVRFGEECWGAYRCALPYDIDPAEIYLDGYMTPRRKVVCGSAVASAVGIPREAWFDSAADAKKLCDKDWDSFWDEIQGFDKWYFFGATDAQLPSRI